MEERFVYLTSKSSADLYSENTSVSFKNQLPQSLYLPSQEYLVGLAEISFKPSFNVLGQDEKDSKRKVIYQLWP